jgi:hypothetical protein
MSAISVVPHIPILIHKLYYLNHDDRNSWNHYHGGVSAKVLMDTADIFVSKGYKDAGYVFINTDDWCVLCSHFFINLDALLTPSI